MKSRARSVWSVLAVPVAALAVTFGVVPWASADQPVAADTSAPVVAQLMTLHATNDGSGIDPAIGKMPDLAKPPLSAYNSYKLLGKSSASLTKGTASSVALPDGSTLSITLKDVIAPKKKGDPKIYVASTSIKNAGGDAILKTLEVKAKPGETFMVAGIKHKGGILVIAIKLP